MPAWSPEVLAKCPPTGRAALSGDASYPPKAEVPQPSVNGTPVVAEAKKQINGQENTASRQKAEGVAIKFKHFAFEHRLGFAECAFIIICMIKCLNPGILGLRVYFLGSMI